MPSYALHSNNQIRIYILSIVHVCACCKSFVWCQNYVWMNLNLARSLLKMAYWENRKINVGMSFVAMWVVVFVLYVCDLFFGMLFLFNSTHSMDTRNSFAQDNGFMESRKEKEKENIKRFCAQKLCVLNSRETYKSYFFISKYLKTHTENASSSLAPFSYFCIEFHVLNWKKKKKPYWFIHLLNQACVFFSLLTMMRFATINYNTLMHDRNWERCFDSNRTERYNTFPTKIFHIFAPKLNVSVLFWSLKLLCYAMTADYAYLTITCIWYGFSLLLLCCKRLCDR